MEKDKQTKLNKLKDLAEILDAKKSNTESLVLLKKINDLKDELNTLNNLLGVVENKATEKTDEVIKTLNDTYSTIESKIESLLKDHSKLNKDKAYSDKYFKDELQTIKNVVADLKNKKPEVIDRVIEKTVTIKEIPFVDAPQIATEASRRAVEAIKPLISEKVTLPTPTAIIEQINEEKDTLIKREKVEGLEELERKADFALSRPLTVMGGGGEVLKLKAGAGIQIDKIGGVNTISAPGSTTDEKVKYDASDPTAGYLSDKVVAGEGITISEGTGTDENKLKISNTWLLDPVEDEWDISAGLPPDPEDGDRYISNGTDEELGWYDGWVYEYSEEDDTWYETIPVEGMIVWIIAEITWWFFMSGGWMEVGETSFVKLDQTVPQLFTGGALVGTGLLNVTDGLLGLDTKTYIEAGDIDWATNVPLNETDPVFSAWLLATPPLYSEADTLATVTARGATTAVASSFTGGATIGTALTLTAGIDIRPSADSTTAINIAQADGTDFVTFDTTNKRVGIGTTSPAARLDIFGGGTGMDLILGGDSGSVGSRTDNANKLGRYGLVHYDIDQEPIALVYGVATNGVNSVRIGGGTSVMNAATEIRLITAANSVTTTGTDRMIIDSAGNVGIGTTAPVQKLHVHNSGTGTGDHSRIHLTTGDSGALAADGMDIGYDADKWSRIINRDGDALELSSIGVTPIYLTTNSVYRMIVDGNGNVGIGTPSPTATLEVNGTFSVKNTTGTQGLYQDASGNVGIGTTTPGSKLTVSGHIGSLGTIPTLTSAGTGSSITEGSTDTAGEITEGTLATGAVITFANAYTNTPFAVVTSQSGLLFSYAVSTTTITITNIGALSETKLNYHVFARE